MHQATRMGCLGGTHERERKVEKLPGAHSHPRD